jgi:ParB/RepB/Spo0J family partition protein
MENEEFKSSLLPLNQIEACFFTTRLETMDEGLEDLVESIRKYGVLEPIIVRTVKDHFELVAGDRRLRAAREVGLRVIPVVIRELSDEDALILQATENLQRQGLSEPEKTRIVTELARRCKLDGKDIADRLKKSYTWVMKYLPSEFKDLAKAEAGSIGGQAKSNGKCATKIVAECEFCGVSTSEPKDWMNHKLCPNHYAEALMDPAKFKRFFGFQQEQPVLGEPVKHQSLESWEDRKARISPEHSEMEETIMQLLLDKDVKPILTNQKYCLLSTVPDFVFPSQNLAVYLDGKAVHNGKQLDRDDELRDLLRKRHGMRVLSITYGSKSKGETDRIFNEIVKEVKKD